MNSHNNDCGLPFEILNEIFSHLASAGHCTFVGPLRRSIMVQCVNLQPKSMDGDIAHEFYSKYRDGWLVRGEACIRCCFIRSRSLPRTINVQYQDEELHHPYLKTHEFQSCGSS